MHATEIASPQVHTNQPSDTGRCFILSGVSWDTYERLLAAKPTVETK